MSEFLSETDGCNLLTRLFRGRGYSIERNLLFREYGVEFHIDGWDAKARVGFEFLSSEDDDHDDLSLAEYQTLADAQQRGELALFIIDEVEPLSAADLRDSANEFLDEVALARESRQFAAANSGRNAARKKPVGEQGAGGRQMPPVGKASKQAREKVAKKIANKRVANKKVANKKVARKVTKKVANTAAKSAAKSAASTVAKQVAKKAGKAVKKKGVNTQKSEIKKPGLKKPGPVKPGLKRRGAQ